MRKYAGVVLFLAVIILSLVYVARGIAVDATEAINPQAQPVIIYGHSRTSGAVDGITKISAAPTKKQTSGQTQIYSGSCSVHSITLYSDTAGDVAGLWDCSNTVGGGRNCVTAWMEFEVGISANTSSNTVNLYGTKFENGIYVSVSDTTNSRVGVIYDY